MWVVIFDAHCDVLMKLWLNKRLSFTYDSALHVTLEGIKKAKGKVQLFAIYIPEAVPAAQRFDVALEMIQLFQSHILSLPGMKWVRAKRDIDSLKKDEIGAMLTLEGCDAIDTSLVRLKTLFSLGVRSVGLTWNYSNAVCDGILEPRGAGLSSFGREVVELNNEHKVWTDVSHLSVRGFWDVIELAHYVVATHSNSHVLCSHPRNLRDDQIHALIKRNGVIGITFVPEFLTSSAKVQIADVIRHLDYMCERGGEYSVGFGSDFDGIDKTVHRLGSYEQYTNLIEELLKHYTEEQVKRFLFQNFADRVCN